MLFSEATLRKWNTPTNVMDLQHSQENDDQDTIHIISSKRRLSLILSAI